MKGAEILKYYLDANGGNQYRALQGYHGYGWDGNTTDAQYADLVTQNYTKLTSFGGLGSGGATGGETGWNAGFKTAFGGIGQLESWGEFNAPSGNGLYGYSTEYGMNGTNHTGLDIVMPLGGAIYAPLAGTVMCAGTGIGSGTNGGGCSAFSYVANFGGAPGARPGSGRIEILLDNGAVLIFGHALGSSVQPGQRIAAGGQVGFSGGMNSAHTHLEARVRDASTPSGWRIVDPRTVLGGAVGTVPVTGGSSSMPGAASRPWWWN